MSNQKTQIEGPLAIKTDDMTTSDGWLEASRKKAREWLRKRIQRLVHRWFWLARGMTLGVRAAAFDREGRIFLVRHGYMPGWHLPGGGVEHGQTVYQALEMELQEEGNLVITDQPELFAVYYNPVASNRDHVALYIVRNVVQSAPRQPDREIIEAEFFHLDALPSGTTQGTLRRLAEIAGHQPQAPVW